TRGHHASRVSLAPLVHSTGGTGESGALDWPATHAARPARDLDLGADRARPSIGGVLGGARARDRGGSLVAVRVVYAVRGGGSAGNCEASAHLNQCVIAYTMWL